MITHYKSYERDLAVLCGETLLSAIGHVVVKLIGAFLQGAYTIPLY